MSTDDVEDFETYRDRVEWPLRRLFQEFGRERWPYFLAGLAINLVERLSSLLPPFLLGVAIDAVFGEGTFTLPLLPAAWVPETQRGQLYFATALILASMVLTAGASVARWFCLDYYSHRLMHEVRTATYRKLQRLDMAFFEREDSGELMSVLNNDVSNFERFFDDALGRATRILTVLLGITAILVYLNWQLALVTLLAVPLLTGATLLFMRRVEPAYDAIRAAVGSMNTRLENNLGGIQLIKSTASEDYEADRVGEVSWEYFRTNWWRIKLELLYHPGTQFISNTSFVATFLVGGYWLVAGAPPYFSGSLTVGELVTFLFLSQRFTGPLKNVSSIVDLYENARASGKRVFGLLDMPVRIRDAPDATTLEDVEGRVVFDDVTFAYDEAPVLDDVAIEAEPGETIALVGPTGAGKSTALKLLPRLYDVDEGAITVDGHDVRDLTLASLRQSIGYVSQETYLFGGTVRENIAYGYPAATEEAVVEAAKAAEAHEFITRLEDGYDTQVGERGVRLSGGQRQRISIARTVLQDPAMLIFDEATSAVDTETELLIQRSLEALSADRTTFVIAHRLSTIRDADRILVFEDGEIVTRGTHEALIAEDGLYANLWRVQAGQLEGLPEDFVETAQERTAQQGSGGETDAG